MTKEKGVMEKYENIVPEKYISRRKLLELGVKGVAALALKTPIGQIVESARNLLNEPLDQTPPSKEAVSIVEAPPPIIIDGIETYGHETPLNQEETDVLIVQFNEKFVRGITTKEDNTVYVTCYVWHDDYDGVPVGTGDKNFQEFLNRHVGLLSQMQIDAHPLLSGGLVVRRLMRVTDEVSALASWHEGWLTDSIKDSNGTEGLWFYRPYEPWRSAYWDTETGNDRGYLHELGHKVFHFPDIYQLEVDFRYPSTVSNLPIESLRLLLHKAEFSTIPILGLTPEKVRAIRKCLEQPNVETGQTEAVGTPSALVDIPPEWQSYFIPHRNDERGESLMLDCKPKYCSYMRWMQTRRVAQEWLHDASRTIPEIHKLPNEVARVNILHFDSKYDGSDITIWRTDGDFLVKTLETKVFAGKVENGEIKIGNPFCDLPKLFPAYQGLLFIRVEKPNGDLAWRWIDIADFLVGLGVEYPYPLGLRMSMELASGNILPDQFDWTIGYEHLDTEGKIFLPLVNNGQ